MTPQPQTFRPRAQPADRAGTRAAPREDARWHRPVFRPPPLDVQPALPELPYLGEIHRTEHSASFPDSAPAK